ncbi:hypothetical protein [Bacteroides heparinolyticus]|uniref:hypothetical protein n=1 Tax=Prevotella heparinolytica TaxID=28113 RepID=UPI0035A1190F
MKLFQTVEDRDNPDYIESNAPFICKAANAWLGEGYYFWDTLIANAHWWGKVRYRENYVIVEYTCDLLNGKCFDLHGNMEHLKSFNEVIDFLKSQKLITKTTTVAKVIEYLKSKAGLASKYDGIRAYGHFSRSNPIFIPFEDSEKSCLELLPAVQICLFRKKSFNLSAGKIIYPNHYNINYLV